MADLHVVVVQEEYYIWIFTHETRLVLCHTVRSNWNVFGNKFTHTFVVMITFPVGVLKECT